MDWTMNTARIYQHEKRKKEWGYAILAYERDDKRGYLFQDGELRAFKADYCHLLVPAAPEDGAQVARNLKEMLAKRKAANANANAAIAKETVPTLSPDTLHDVFVTEFPGGLSGDAYADTIRGRGAKRRLKRHRDAAVAEAVEALSIEALDGATERGAHEETRDTLVRVLASTDLLTKKQLAPLAKLPADALPELALTLRRVLYGTGPYEARLERFVRVLERSKEKVSWELATAPAALVLPDQHLYVKSTAMKQLVERIAPGLGWTATPSGFVYSRLRGLGEELARWLAEHDDAARDFLDVAMLVETAMRPKHRAALSG